VAALASEMVQTVEKYDARLVCISALPPSAVAHARYLCKRVRARKKDIPVLVGLWGTKVDSKKAMARLACSENDKVVRTLADARAEIAPMVAVPAAEPETKQRETEIESLNH
jgi:hypothetical protein